MSILYQPPRKRLALRLNQPRPWTYEHWSAPQTMTGRARKPWLSRGARAVTWLLRLAPWASRVSSKSGPSSTRGA